MNYEHAKNQECMHAWNPFICTSTSLTHPIIGKRLAQMKYRERERERERDTLWYSVPTSIYHALPPHMT